MKTKEKTDNFNANNLKINYKKEYTKRFNKNKKEFLDRLNSNNLSKADKVKISRYCSKFEYKEKDVIKNLKENEFLVDFFVPDPSRQSFHENIMYERLYTAFDNVSFMKIEQLNNKKLYINHKGKIVSIDELRKEDVKTKSVDFRAVYTFKNKDLLFLMSAKYTKEDGGAQDNQRNDMINFLENASKSTDKNINFLGIIEGNYYKKIRRSNEKSYLESFKESYDSQNINVDNLYNTSRKIIEMTKSWLIENFKDDKDRQDELEKLNKMLSTY